MGGERGLDFRIRARGVRRGIGDSIRSPCEWAQLSRPGHHPLVLFPQKEIPQQVLSCRAGPQWGDIRFAQMGRLGLSFLEPSVALPGPKGGGTVSIALGLPSAQGRNQGVDVRGEKLGFWASKQIVAYRRLLFPCHPILIPPVPAETQN